MLRKLLTNGHIKCVKRFSSSKVVPELTKDRYNVKRGEYSSLTDGHLAFFTDLLGQNRVINDPSECESYNVDWIKNVRGESRCVLKPRTTEEVSKILEFCNENKLAVCPQGGNTGLVGGSVPVFDEIVLSTALMNNLESVDEISGVIVCQAGCILENIDQQIGEKGLMVPLDLGAKGSCHIGGNVSTNAGGLRLLRYGNLHGSVLGVEAVKANGEILDCLSTLKKDNTGYHLKHLFIGSEGSLGVVTKVAIQCPTKPKAVNMAFLGVESFDSVLTTFRRCKDELGEILSSFELIDALSLDVVTGHYKMQSPIPQYPFYILIETHGSCNEHDEQKLSRFLENAMGDGVVLDGTATNQPSKMKHLWELRESITQGLLMDGYVFKYDLSIPIKEFYAIVDVMTEKIGKDAVRISGYGHIGDSNIHLNLSFKEYSKEMHMKIEPFVYEYTASLKGSVSAEHGIGFRKSKQSAAMIRTFGLKRIASIRCFSSSPDFTKNNYNVQRGGYQTLEEDHIRYFQTLLGENRLVMDLSDLEQYNVDWFKHYRGNSKLVLKPKTTEEVSKILSYCNKNKLAVCPQGGNTGVVGGQVPVFDEIIISTALMNQIESIDEHLGVLVCQSGCILENLDNELEKNGFMMPLDLGAKGSCHIGGNVSTNAGGLRLLRYGNMHGNVLGLEAVKASGEIVDLMSSLKKDNTGFHLKHLFIGSEGTLGVVTKVAIQCAVRPKSVNLAFLGLQSFPKVLKTFVQAKQDLGEILSAMEVMDSATMDFVKDKLKVESPIGEYPFYLVIETSGSNDEHDADKLHKFLETTLNKHFTLNGTVATEPSKVKEMWQIRERIPDSFVKDEYVFLYDVTLPIHDYFTLVDDVRGHLGAKGKVFGFGHLGDGNLHIQVAVDKYSHEIKDFIEDYLYSRVVELKGSISAEHGIGFAKIKYLERIKDKNALIFMRQMKRLMDPNGILNPYKLIFEQH